jgi:thioredoxin reductase (NADPH)
MATSLENQKSHSPVVKIFGKFGCPLAYSIRDFLHRNDVPFEWNGRRTDAQCREIGV